ncbi:MAG: 3-hydroxyacyl-CoA dehydrogenase/enoyl-CoA hydratase family protein [Deltaproteobacteria bacterium]|nr:3-hydroxyacyl-CoA dehydrogenase/enoyl-CoA hydratase family protein [Deltaproteobacteria bacterium]
MATKRIHRVGVLGAGVMGTGIAAHLANAGVEVVLLDIPIKDGKSAKNALVERALEMALKASPKAFFHPSRMRLITAGNFEDDLPKLSDCQWVVEAVKEDLAIKRDLFAKVEAVTGDGTAITSNTSGIPLGMMAEGRSAGFVRRLFITHFFNPARYMKLVEIVSGPATDRALVERLSAFIEDALGKGVVRAKDTPNFIANRIGTYGMMRALKEMEAQGSTVEEMDAIFGKPLGRPKSAIFRTADVVGLDTLTLVAKNCHQNLPNDPERALYQLPSWVTALTEQGNLGQKSGKGFYKKGTKSPDNPKGLEAWDWKEKVYRPLGKVRIDSLGAARNIEDLAERMRTVAFADDRAGKIAWPVLRDTLAYAMNLVGEISDEPESIDQALRWGFAWDQGPFESWDALGFEKVAARMEAEGVKLAPWIKELRASGAGGIYAALKKSGKAQKRDAKRIDLKTRKTEGAKVVKQNDGASLIDVGDDVFALEFHTKANSIDADVTRMLVEGTEWVEENGRGLVIYNEGEHFSVGANLMLIYMLAQAQDWKQLEAAVEALQQGLQRVRYAGVPVIAAPSGMALGGGCEICLATGSAAGLRPVGEVYMGLVEVGVGLIPGAGGTMNTLFSLFDRIPSGVEVDPLQVVGQAFKQIAMAQVSTSVEEARAMGYVPMSAGVTMDRRRQLFDAKSLVLGLSAAGHRPPVPRAFKLPGESGIATLKTMVRGLVQAGQATAYEGHIATKLATVLCGGPAGHTRLVTEQAVLDLEREVFLSLAGEAKSQERMMHMLTNNKPLRN